MRSSKPAFGKKAAHSPARAPSRHPAYRNSDYVITVTRNRGLYGAARALVLYAQTPSGRVRLGSVKHGKSTEVEIPRDATQIYGKMDWAKSVPMDLAFVSAGETIYANLWFTINPFRIIGIPTMPCKIEGTPR